MDATESQAEAWTVERLLAWTHAHLRENRIESPRLCAELLLARALGCERIELYTRYDSAPAAAALDPFREWVRQAAEGKPVAYLLGTREFFSLEFEVTPDVLIPRPETETLVERAIEAARAAPLGQSEARILDLCTGSGCIAISLAKHLPQARFVATDISSDALEVARRNADRHDVGERIAFHAGDLYDAMPDAAAFDIITCNPPYVSTTDTESLDANVRDYEPHVALFGGPDGLEIIRRVVDGAAERLSGGGLLFIEVAYDQATAVRALLAEADWEQIETYRDLADHERIVQARRNARSETQVA